MSGITIFRQILIKEVVTDDSKEKKIKQINEAITEALERIKEFDENKSKALTEASLRGADQNQLDRFRQQLESEAAQYYIERDELMHRMDGINQLAIGEEVVLASVEGPFELQIGQTLQEATAAEIVIIDGVIVEIRNS
jgi:hypothetical protein